MGKSNFKSVIKGSELVIILLGGHPSNTKDNCNQLINKIRKVQPSVPIVWIGAPPAFPPTKRDGEMVSTNPDSKKFWEKKWESRRKRNVMIGKLIKSLKSAGDQIDFINPYESLTKDTYKPNGDGIHVPSGYGKFLGRYFGSMKVPKTSSQSKDKKGSGGEDLSAVQNSNTHWNFSIDDR